MKNSARSVVIDIDEACLAHEKNIRAKTIYRLFLITIFHFESNFYSSAPKGFIELSFSSLHASNFLLPSPTLENTVSAATPKKQQMNNKKLYERKENISSERQTDFPKKFIDTQHVTIVSQ